jgi:anaerobic magnesium-protoporphyrin IX monomethyl ester cyclase
MRDFRVLFLYPNLKKESTIPPSIIMLSRILKNDGFETDVFDSTKYDISGKEHKDRKEEILAARISDHINVEILPKERFLVDLNNKVAEFGPDLIAISATESTFLLGIDMIRCIKNLDAPVVLGGVFATFASERALCFKEIDMVIVGEGEETLLELCEKMREEKDMTRIQSLWLKGKNGEVIKNPIRAPVDINKNPTDFDVGLFEEWRYYRPMGGKLYRMFSVETARGCPYECTFCNTPSQKKLHSRQGFNFFRNKAISNVREEIANYVYNFKAEYLFFWADTFFSMSSKDFDTFCEMYEEFKLPFFIQSRPETISRKKLEKLKRVGLHRLAVGIEQGNEEFRKRVLKRMYSNKEAIENLKIPVELGIPFSTFNMIGMPDETRELVMDTVELNRELESDTTNFATFTPFYGTPLREYAISKGYMESDTICCNPYDEPVLNIPKERIQAMKRVFAMYVKFPKERWDEIRLAEEFSDEGNAKWRELKEEFVKTFF